MYSSAIPEVGDCGFYSVLSFVLSVFPLPVSVLFAVAELGFCDRNELNVWVNLD